MRFNCLKLFSLFLGVIFFAVANLQAQQVVRVYMSDGSTVVYDRVDSLVCTVEEQEIYADDKIYRTSISEVDSVVYNFTPVVTTGQLIDLGLSVKWAGWNVGATSPEEYGGYYAWGELEEKDDYSQNSYLYWDKDKKECQFIGNNICATQYDVARAKWGGSWRMPTLAECQELIDNCKWEWITYNGVNGQKVTGPNGNSIFLPAAGFFPILGMDYKGFKGYCWPGTLYVNDNNNAYFLDFSSNGPMWYHCNRYLGHSVRPVSGELKIEPSVSTRNAISITANSAILEGFIEGTDISSDYHYGFLYSTDSDLLSEGLDVRVASHQDGIYTCSLSNLKENTTYYYCAYLSVDGQYTYGIVRSFTTEKKKDEITPGQMVDLGLSVKWAGWNVGASRPEEYGGYYAWGELEEKSDYSLNTYQYYDQANKAYQFIGDNISGTQYDVARTQWGGNWRMPTKEEFQELVDRCDWEWAKYNGVSGQKVIGPNGNSIFLPAAGYRHGQHFSYRGSDGHYWMGDFYRDDSKNAYFLYFYYGYEHWNYDYRFDGFSVRPVFDEIKHEF